MITRVLGLTYAPCMYHIHQHEAMPITGRPTLNPKMTISCQPSLRLAVRRDHSLSGSVVGINEVLQPKLRTKCVSEVAITKR